MGFFVQVTSIHLIIDSPVRYLLVEWCITHMDWLLRLLWVVSGLLLVWSPRLELEYVGQRVRSSWGANLVHWAVFGLIVLLDPIQAFSHWWLCFTYYLVFFRKNDVQMRIICVGLPILIHLLPICTNFFPSLAILASQKPVITIRQVFFVPLDRTFEVEFLVRG